MEILKVELLQPTDEQKEMGATPAFSITTDENAMATIVPNDPANSHYWHVKAWYEAQDKKPFKFEFEELPEAEPEPESDEDGSGLTLAADQIEDAELPELNLTKEQLREMREKRAQAQKDN